MKMNQSLLTAEQARATEQVLREESARREHLVVHLSGAHAYGFPSPDSDVDLKAIHIASTTSLLAFKPPPPAADRAEFVNGVEMDYTSNELSQALLGILKGNGNFLERVLGTTALQALPLLDTLKPLVRRALSRRLHAHYSGFARGQLREFQAKSTAKRALYVLRTALTGTHALRTGDIVPDLTALLDEYGLGEARQLVAIKLSGERAPLEAALATAWEGRLLAVLETLDREHERSILPVDPPNAAELEAWLLSVRRSRF
jgi:predicted nucleotidyltransferase